MDTKKKSGTKLSSPVKTRQIVRRMKRQPRNWPVILGVLLILAAVTILVLALIPKDGKQKEGGLVQVPYDIQSVREEQKSVDEGHSPWKKDPIFVTQVFVSLKIYPDGIKGDYPIHRGDLKVTKMTNREAVVQVDSPKTNISVVYLKRLVRKNDKGIWTVTAYGSKDANKSPDNVPPSKMNDSENKENKGNYDGVQ
ncbi:MAG: hypothetical protein GX144_00345 [Clostridiaceae bacterium]|jgi:hypothetical protein|nr:hypothetical protein [Clostridiaceae bacterium]